METLSLPLVLLIISIIMIAILFFYVNKIKNKNQLQKVFCLDLICVFIICFNVFLQAVLSKPLGIDPMAFECVIYIGTCFLPVFMFFTGLIFYKGSIKFKPVYLLTCIIPMISLIMLWTNNYHHLFYQVYSTDLDKIQYGKYLPIHNIYTYSLLLAGIVLIYKKSKQNSGAFSRQSLLIIIGSCIPLVVNILGTLKIIPMNVYVTPICFALTMLFFSLAIFKYQFLGISSIALNIIVNRISDGYLVLSTDYDIIGYNKTFLDVFNVDESIKGENIFNSIKRYKFSGFNTDNLLKVLSGTNHTSKTFSSEVYFAKLNKYFQIEINSLFNKKSFLGILILFKDITQHKEDIKTIEDNQNTLMERERLATLGQMIGGIAHNLKTPIMSIAGAMEGLQDLITEYDRSIDDPEVTKADHHAIAHDMKDWIDKVNSYDAYMSDIITAVKGQTVNFNDSSVEDFTIDELLKDVTILMKHELKSALITLDIDCQIDKKTTLRGNVNSLVQVVNNLISNAIQSYNGKQNEEILLTILQKNNNIVISVRDHGSGIPEEVQKKLFSEMITTKGHNGTGLGLFMSYSTIKGHFNGELSFESKVGEGTTFYITLPKK